MPMTDQLLSDLREAMERLADAVVDRRSLAATLRRLADDLPDPRRTYRLGAQPRNPSAIQGLLWDALAEGLLDARRFDVAMVARARAARILNGAHAPRLTGI